MTVLTTVSEVRAWLHDHDRANKSVGLVPTMGFLHDGHKSLIERAHADNDIVIVSDFVNPIQFGEGEDYSSYPRDLDHDHELATAAGADVVFHPSVEELYPAGAATEVEVKAPLTHVLCGASRPIHFKGVTTVVAKMLNIVGPDRVYFGQKDAQQTVVVAQMIRDMLIPVQMIVCPIVREADGLALSSRNTYLDAEQRKAALVLHRALDQAAERFAGGERSAGALRGLVRETIEEQPQANIEYVEIVDAHTLDQIDTIESGHQALAAVAVRFGDTRLIDNCLLGIEGG
ncbi:pantoate--beta-alanine ligase [Propionibacterium sp.]|uniref:pantoate--beta-alanine ligase n=1 Tax=Propionibacterium sp. TaxID=1977903 RepID=UPI0039E864D7